MQPRTREQSNPSGRTETPMFALPPARGRERLVPPIPQRFGLPRRQAWPRPSPHRLPGTRTLRGFQGDSNFALPQRTASGYEERRHRQWGPLPSIRGMEIVKAPWPRAVTQAASAPPDSNPGLCQVNADTASLSIHSPPPHTTPTVTPLGQSPGFARVLRIARCRARFAPSPPAG